MNRIKPVISLALICILTITITGCNIFKKDSKTDTDISKIKENMLNDLDNFQMDVTITSQTGFADIKIEMSCIQDNKNKREYCKTSTLGVVDVEQYIDFNNKKEYTKKTSLFDNNNNDKWEVQNIKADKDIQNAWFTINDYLKDLNVEEHNGGKLYKGKISMKKVTKAITKSDNSSSIKIPSITDKDIDIQVFVNKDGYIESSSMSFEIATIKEIIDIKYKNFNGNNDVELPKLN